MTNMHTLAHAANPEDKSSWPTRTAAGHDRRTAGPCRVQQLHVATLVLWLVLGLGVAFPGHALDLVNFADIDGPLASALTQIAALGPGIKALVGFVGFVVALISLAALRNFGPVLFYVGLAIFAAVGLVIAGAIMGAVI
ncbi:hypothetical protein [Rubrivivax albus]|uniref:hypothetical protein n=1 Tax=Rubrivivax albus TaxID=2499835 RepID=UPI001E321F6B|nr:hypothetical protein [Rubrivivax albus]